SIVLISFFVAYGLLELCPRYPVWGRVPAPALALGLVLFSAQWTFPAVQHLHAVKSPPAQLFDYIRTHLNPKTDALIVDPMIRILPRYYQLSEFHVVSQFELDQSQMEAIQNLNWYYIGPAQFQPGFVPQVRFRAENERIDRIKGSALNADLMK